MRHAPVPATALSHPAATRLAALAPLSMRDRARLEQARSAPNIRQGREITAEGAPAELPRMVVAGWAALVRDFRDGRRQILSLLLPGEVLGDFHPSLPTTPWAVVALTEVAIADAPAADPDGALEQAYRAGADLQRAYTLNHIVRLGRMDAYERIADWLLETRDRLALSGLVDEGAFPMPLTQDMLGDLLGLTSVHVNRTLQVMRREGSVDLRSGWARLLRPAQLAEAAEYRA